MPIRLVELSPEQVGVDESRFPDRDDSHVYRHLLFYYSLLEVLPAISIRVDEAGAAVTRGHKTPRAARESVRTAVRAIVQPASGRSYSPGRAPKNSTGRRSTPGSANIRSSTGLNR